jgi:homoserine/homoserine lactone efflux protein
VILFFAAFLPQFIDPTRSLLIQFAVLAGTFAVIEFSMELLVASLANRISTWLTKVGRRFNQSCGAAFIAIGLALPLRA